jgi:hypothetical protein
MEININLSHFTKTEETFQALTHAIKDVETQIDEYCSEFVKSQGDLQMITIFNTMLNDMYDDLETIKQFRSTLYN